MTRDTEALARPLGDYLATWFVIGTIYAGLVVVARLAGDPWGYSVMATGAGLVGYVLGVSRGRHGERT